MQNNPLADKFGFVPGIPGHYLQVNDPDGPDQWGRHHVMAECTCGMDWTYMPIMKSGKANARNRNHWINHLEGVSAPDELITIGRIVKKRVTLTVVVVPSTYSQFDKFAANAWLSTEQIRLRGSWVRGIMSSTGEWRIDRFYPSRQWAIDRSVDYLRSLQRRGQTVEWVSEQDNFQPPAFAAESSLEAMLEMYDAALASDDSGVVIEAIQHAELILTGMVLVKGKRDALIEKLTRKGNG